MGIVFCVDGIVWISQVVMTPPIRWISVQIHFFQMKPMLGLVVLVLYQHTVCISPVSSKIFRALLQLGTVNC